MAISPILIYRYLKAKCKNTFHPQSVSTVTDAMTSTFSSPMDGTSKEISPLVSGLKPRKITSSSIVSILLPNSRQKRFAVYISLSLIFIFIAFLIHFTFIVVGLGLAYKSYVFSFHPQLLNITDLYTFSTPIRFEANAVSVSFVDILFKKFIVDIYSIDDTKLEHPLISQTLNNLYFYGNRKENFISCDINFDLNDNFPLPDFSKAYEFLIRYSFEWDLSCAWIPTSISHFLVTNETIYSPADSFDIEYDNDGEIILIARDPPIETADESCGDWDFDRPTCTMIFKANALSFDAQYGPFTLDTVTISAQKSSIILDITLIYKHELEYLALSLPPCNFVISVKSCCEDIDDQLIGYGALDRVSIDPNNKPARIRFTIEVPFDHHFNHLDVNNTELNSADKNATNSSIPGLSIKEFETFLASSQVRLPSNDSISSVDFKLPKELTGTPKKLQSIIRNFLTRRFPILFNLLFSNVTDSKLERWANDKGGIRLKMKGSPSRSAFFQFYASLIVVLGYLFDFYIDASHFILIMKHILII